MKTTVHGLEVEIIKHDSNIEKGEHNIDVSIDGDIVPVNYFNRAFHLSPLEQHLKDKNIDENVISDIEHEVGVLCFKAINNESRK